MNGRLVNIGIDTDTDTFAVSVSVLPILLYGNIGSGIADTFSADFCRYSIPIQLEEEIQFFI